MEEVSWGGGPVAYPCLVASYPISKQKVIGCYVYPNHAASLLEATGKKFPQAIPVTPVSAPRVDETRVPAIVARFMSDQAEFNKSNLAHHLTQISFLVDTGIAKPEQYEKQYAIFLADVDQIAADDRQKLIEAKAILDKLEGTE